MSNTLSLRDWLDVIKEEYLTQFLQEGGSSIKFVVPLGAVDRYQVMRELESMAGGMNYIVVRVDASETRVHMADDVFCRAASQFPWRLSARKVVLRLAQEIGYQTEGIAAESAGPLLSAIASASSSPDQPLSEEFIFRELRPKLESAVSVNRNLARDFRVAMTHLCLAETRDTSESQEGAPIIDWLTGANRRISSVRAYSIYNSINRTNARHFFESLLHWTKFVGYAGFVALLDDSRITLRRRQSDGLRFYTRPMAMDHYELLREFIDGTDRLESFLMVVLADEDFLDEGAGRSDRGMGIYRALMGRIADEVRDRTLINPMSALVRLSDKAGPE